MSSMDTLVEPESIGSDGLPVMPAPPAWYWMLLGRVMVLAIVGYSLWYYPVSYTHLTLPTKA